MRITAPYMRDKVKLHSVECFSHGMLVGTNRAFRCRFLPHTLAPYLYPLRETTAPYMRDKVKLHSVECFSPGMLVERIGHLGAVFSILRLLHISSP